MIGTLSRIARLDSDRRWLLAEAVVILAAMNVLVRAQPAGWIHRRRIKRLRSAPSDSIVWAVRAAAGHLPGSTCLTSALTAHMMLTRRGYAAVVRFGVAPPGGRRGTPLFHAWLECDGRAVIGAESLESYRALESCNATAARIANSTAFAGR